MTLQLLKKNSGMPMRFTFRVSSLSSEQQVCVPWGRASEELRHTQKHSDAMEFLYAHLMGKLASGWILHEQSHGSQRQIHSVSRGKFLG